MWLKAYRFLAYYGSLAGFAVVALAFNLVCAFLGPGSDPRQRERAVQRAIHRLFRRVTQWAVFTRLLDLEFRGFDGLPLEGRVVVANHPGLLDAIYLLARLPTAICVFKPALRRNPLLGSAAIRAGYLASDHALDLVRGAAAKVAAGATLLVFPEGTRTPAGCDVGAFKPGFALIARRARAPVQLVRITVNGSLLTKGQAWWKLPRLPVRIILEAGPCLSAGESGPTAGFVRQVEGWFHLSPAKNRTAEFEAFPAGSSSFTLPA